MLLVAWLPVVGGVPRLALVAPGCVGRATPKSCAHARHGARPALHRL